MHNPSLNLRPWLLLAVLVASPARLWATEVGLDAGAPVWDGVVNSGAWDAVPATDVQWVRLNFRLDQWSSPYDGTPHGPMGMGWLATYNAIVDAYLARGLRIYGVLSDELVTGVANRNSQEFVDTFNANAIAVVDLFKDRVRVYEVINEPNDWGGGSSPRFDPYWYAKILQDTYLAVKYNGGHYAEPCWQQVMLVSGPLFSGDGNSAATYLQQTYDAGRNQLGWDWTHTNAGSYPLDGVGYHIYVAQTAGTSLASVSTNTTANLQALWSVVAGEEGAATPKQIWVSEFGWRHDVFGDSGQADRLEAGFNAMKAFGRVAVAFYFQLQDYPGNEWGLYSSGGLDAGNRRPSADRLKAIADANRPAHAAHLLAVSAPVLPPGGTGNAVLTLENRGSATWTAVDAWRLGSGAGCPYATTVNAIDWSPSAGAGFANSPTDSRIFLNSDVPAGGTVVITVPVTAPASEGVVTFAARMVHENVAWFGTTAVASVTVSANACMSGQTRPCYRGDPATQGVGLCHAGTEQCSGSYWAGCTDDVTPAGELCDGYDNDCDGRTDEDWPIGSACSAGLGACLRSGTYECNGPGAFCNAIAGAPGGEVCEGVTDEDCDGTVDNGCACTNGQTRSCYGGDPATLGVGLCHGGTELCSGGAWAGCTDDVTPTGELCDGYDNDCDGTVDNGCGCSDGEERPCYSGPSDTLGVGACMSGTQQCSAGVWGNCDGQTLPADELCADQVDNDCDDYTDAADLDGCPPRAADPGRPPSSRVLDGSCACASGGASSALIFVAVAILATARRRRRS